MVVAGGQVAVRTTAVAVTAAVVMEMVQWS